MSNILFDKVAQLSVALNLVISAVEKLTKRVEALEKKEKRNAR